MSGIEVAGLVLGGIPLIISGLEHYGQGVRAIRSMWDYPNEFASLCRLLRIENVLFQNNLEHLLSGCIDDEVLTNLWQGPAAGEDWLNGDADFALQKKLQRSYTVYLETVKSMSRSLDAFKQRLRLNANGEVPFTDPRSFKSAYKRFKFGIKKSAYMDLVQELKRDNSSLRHLADQSRFQSLGRSFRRQPNFEKTRSHATSLFSSLQRSLNNACQATHEVDLCVPAPTSDELATFRLVLRHKASPLASSWLYEEAEIRSTSSKSSLNARGNGSTAGGSTVKSQKRGRVSFAQNQPMATNNMNSTTVVSTAAEIHDLCGSILRVKSAHCKTCLGILTDPSRDLQHGLYSPSTPLVDRKASLDMLSLGELLSQKPGNSLSVADTKHLAVELSACVLRLYDTPWLGRQWGRNEITLFKKGSKVLAEYPFVSARMLAVPSLTAASGHVYFQSGPAIPNETVFALGILLIELCLRQPFDQLILPSELNADGSKNPMSDYCAALRLLDQVDDTAGHRYGDAVRRCVRGHFEQRKTSLEDEAFRRAVYDGVVAELQDDANQFFGRT